MKSSTRIAILFATFAIKSKATNVFSYYTINSQKQSSCKELSSPSLLCLSSSTRHDYESSISPLLLNIRGGDSKRNNKTRKSKTASLHSTKTKTSESTKKTATGKPAVTGGVSKSSDSRSNSLSSTLSKYKSILPLTRFHITLIGFVTILSLIMGEEQTQALLALDPIRTFNGMELWRPLTAASFLGPPSIGWLMNAYYLFEYGSSLERAFGTPQHLIFLLGQIILLTMLSALLGQPFYGPSVITAMLHVLSRSMPKQKVKWIIFTVPYWSLPYGLMATDVLQSQNIMSALPHIMGILTGHFYYFHKFIWTKLGGEDWLAPPDFLVQRLDPDARGDKEKINAALKKNKRKRGKGRKLGS